MVTFGYQVVTDNDEYVGLVERAASLTIAPGAPGSTPPDFIPLRKSRSFKSVVWGLPYISYVQSRAVRHIPLWFPGSGLSRLARNTKELVRILSEMPYAFVKSNRVC